MFAFHTVADECGKIYLWAEDSTLPQSRPNEQKSLTDTTDGERHPFAVDKLTLNDILSHAGCGNANTALSTLTVYLPSSQDAPQPSPSIQKEDASGTTTSLTSWHIPVVEIDPRDAPSILSRLSQKTPDYPGTSIEPGQTVHYWCAVCSVAQSYVDSGRVAPHLAKKEGSATGVWRAFPSTAADINRITELVEAMPPFARASVEVGSNYRRSPSDSIARPSRDVLTCVLDQLVNVLSKERLSATETDLTTDELEPIHQQWISTLQENKESIDADPEVIAGFREQLEEWTRPPMTEDEQEVRLSTSQSRLVRTSAC